MKSNHIKYIFFCIVIVLIIIAIYIIYQNQEKEQGNTVTQETEEEISILTELKMGISNFDTMNPIISTNKNVQEISRLIYEPLLSITQDYKIELCLAKEWTKLNPTSYLLKLKDNVYWQDGTKFTASDVKFTIDKLKNEAIQSVYAINVGNIIELQIIDEYTIKIILNEEVPYFEYNLIFPIISRTQFDSEDFLNSSKNAKPLGTGRYKILSNTDTEIELIKNNGWWNIENNNAKIENIVIKLFSSAGEVYNAFKMGNIDIMTTSTINLEQYIGSMGFSKVGYPGREYDFLAMNCEQNVLSNTEVRQAIKQAIDIKKITLMVFNDQYYVANFPLDYGNYVWEKTQTEYIQGKATETLTQNGWVQKNGSWQKTQNNRTQRINLDLVVKSSNETNVKVAELIKQQLEAEGIKINLIKASDSRYQSYLQNKNYELMLVGINTPLSPDINTYYGEQNIANYKNEEIRTILNELKSIQKEDIIQEKYKRIKQINEKDCPYVGLYFNRNTVLHNMNLIGDIRPNNYNIFYNMEKWYIQGN